MADSPEKKVGPFARGPEFSEAARVNNSADAPLIPGFTLLNRAESELAMGLVYAAVADELIPGTVRLNREGTESEFRAILLDIDSGRHTFGLLFFGWEPGNRFSAAKLHDAFSEIHNGDPDTDDVISDLSNRRLAKTLLTDFSLCREAAKGMQGDGQTRDAICIRFMDGLQDLTNWNGVIPDHVIFYVSQPRPIAEVKP